MGCSAGIPSVPACPSSQPHTLVSSVAGACCCSHSSSHSRSLPFDSSPLAWQLLDPEEEEIKEGLLPMSQATHHRCTGLLSWKPDHVQAGSVYQQATLAFPSTKRLEEEAEAFLQEAEAHERNGVPLCAARAYEQAGLSLSKSEQLNVAAQALNDLVYLYLESSKVDVLPATLRRFSQLLQSQVLHQRVYLYCWASNLFEVDEGYLPALDFPGPASKALVRNKRHRDTAICLRQGKHMDMEVEGFALCHQRAVARCLAHLCHLEFRDASNLLKESRALISTFQSSDECVVMEKWLNSSEDQDQDRVDQVCSSCVFKHMDQEYGPYRNMTRMLMAPDI
ncbi:gamma-soluble NSF attachment protein-like [Notamacropus eugenii]|uniref:gamma-soluble NSF attachment protein-like n=1 Tax=Notamacropus eugenii TaxID=9315 RepID=UPI003B678D4B